MYNPFRNRNKTIKRLEEKQSRHSDLIDECLAEITELTLQNKSFKDMFSALVVKVDALKERQDRLREGLFNMLTHEQEDHNND